MDSQYTSPIQLTLKLSHSGNSCSHPKLTNLLDREILSRNQKVAESGEQFTFDFDCLHNVSIVLGYLGNGPVRNLTEAIFFHSVNFCKDLSYS